MVSHINGDALEATHLRPPFNWELASDQNVAGKPSIKPNSDRSRKKSEALNDTQILERANVVLLEVISVGFQTQKCSLLRLGSSDAQKIHGIVRVAATLFRKASRCHTLLGFSLDRLTPLIPSASPSSRCAPPPRRLSFVYLHAYDFYLPYTSANMINMPQE